MFCGICSVKHSMIYSYVWRCLYTVLLGDTSPAHQSVGRPLKGLPVPGVCCQGENRTPGESSVDTQVLFRGLYRNS